VPNQGTSLMEQKFSDINGEMVIIFWSLLPTGTTVPLSHGEDRLLRGENCAGQLNIEPVSLL
jgi:hypothetical protein